MAQYATGLVATFGSYALIFYFFAGEDHQILRINSGLINIRVISILSPYGHFILKLQKTGKTQDNRRFFTQLQKHARVAIFTVSVDRF